MLYIYFCYRNLITRLLFHRTIDTMKIERHAGRVYLTCTTASIELNPMLFFLILLLLFGLCNINHIFPFYRFRYYPVLWIVLYRTKNKAGSWIIVNGQMKRERGGRSRRWWVSQMSISCWNGV